MKKTEVIILRVSKTDKEKIRAKAESNGLSVSSYLIMSALRNRK